MNMLPLRICVILAVVYWTITYWVYVPAFYTYIRNRSSITKSHK